MLLPNQVGSWLGCSTRLLAQLAPQVRTCSSPGLTLCRTTDSGLTNQLLLPNQATVYTVDTWDADYLSEKEGEAAMFGGSARQGLDDAVQHTKQLVDQVPLYETFVRCMHTVIIVAHSNRTQPGWAFLCIRA